MISLADFTKLKKIMALAMSDNEGERNSALNMANKILRDNSLTWTAVLERTVSIGLVTKATYTPTPMGKGAEPDVVHKPAMNADERKAAIETAFEILDHSNDKFIISLKEQFEETGWLTKAQRAALFENAERVSRR